MEMLGGSETKDECRDVSIMSDAAYVMLTKDSKSYTGNFAIDDEVLWNAGIKDMEQYACVPGVFGCLLKLILSPSYFTRVFEL